MENIQIACIIHCVTSIIEFKRRKLQSLLDILMYDVERLVS